MDMEWISVYYELPKEEYYGSSEMVLITDGKGVFTAWRNLRTHQWDCDTGHDIKNITHWMPLPKPPEK